MRNRHKSPLTLLLSLLTRPHSFHSRLSKRTRTLLITSLMLRIPPSSYPHHTLSSTVNTSTLVSSHTIRVINNRQFDSALSLPSKSINIGWMNTLHSYSHCATIADRWEHPLLVGSSKMVKEFPLTKQTGWTRRLQPIVNAIVGLQ